MFMKNESVKKNDGFRISKCSQVPLWRGPTYHDIIYDTAMIMAESESDVNITTDTRYLAITGDIWVINCEDFV